MQGKILGLGVIRGDDGNRYSFELGDIENLNEYNPQKLAGCQVDFEIIDGKRARDIFLILSNYNYRVTTDGVEHIRIMFLVSIVLTLFAGFIGFLGTYRSDFATQMFFNGVAFACLFTGCVFVFIAIKKLSGISASKTLYRKLINCLFSFLLCVVCACITFFMLVNFNFNIKKFLYPLLLPYCAAFVATIIFLLCVVRELSFVMQQWTILWAFYFIVLGVFTLSILIGFLFCLIGLILLIIGFMRFKEIRIRTEYDKLPWF